MEHDSLNSNPVGASLHSPAVACTQAHPGSTVEFPAHVAADWLGHSTRAAHKHYWQTTDADFEKAQQSEDVREDNEAKDEREAAENPADCGSLHYYTGVQVGDTRLELVTPSLSS